MITLIIDCDRCGQNVTKTEADGAYMAGEILDQLKGVRNDDCNLCPTCQEEYGVLRNKIKERQRKEATDEVKKFMSEKKLESK